MKDLQKKLEEKRGLLKQLESNYNAVLGQITLLEELIEENKNEKNNK